MSRLFPISLSAAVLAAASHTSLLAQEPAAPPAAAETPAAGEEEVEEGEEEIVVTGQRERGAVIGDIKPEVQLGRGEIRAYGASNLAELLDALAPQTRSTRGRGEGRPAVLLNGRRISGFSEIRDIPPEAIIRVDVLPEEAALKYGYRADQRVVNFVLRRRFRAITAEVEPGFATEGGRATFETDIDLLRISEAGRTNIGVEYERATPLFETERSLTDAEEFRTLLAETDQFSLNGTVNRTILNDVSATLNGRFDAGWNTSFLGLSATGGSDPLTRDSDTLAGHLGVVLNGDLSDWRWSFTGNYDRSSRDTVTERNFGRDRAETLSDVFTSELVANGDLLALPAGDVSTTLRAGFDAAGLDSGSTRGGVFQESDLSRTRAHAQANVDLPIASRRRDVLSFLGNLSANFNAEVEHFSDFGTLRTLGAGLTWSPIPQVNLIASFTDEDGAPTMQQLGDPAEEVPNVRVFDFIRGETVEVTRIEGGNPGLIADNRRVWKLGGTVTPFSDIDLSLTANYTNSRIRNPIASFPTATAEIEAAFPDRFSRDADGRLFRIDSRPVNFERSDREELRWGVNFSKRLGPPPPEGGFRRRQTEGGAPTGERRRGAGEGGPRGVGGGFGGRGFGGGRSGRLQLSVYHTWRLEDQILIREGVPVLDLLGGSAIGNTGGRPEHEVEVVAGVNKNGFGARLTGTWRSGTFVRGGPNGAGGTTGDLRFSDLTTVNLRLFADLGAQRALVTRHPWLRGTRISLNVNNLFNQRLEVRDETGATPFTYQPSYLDPLGRSVSISIRKLFF